MMKMIWLVLGFAMIPQAVYPVGIKGISLGGKDLIRIEVDEEPDRPLVQVLQPTDLSRENRRLRERVRRLEMAVRQMQDRLFALETTPKVVVETPAKDVACYIQTTFHGTALGKASTEVEARAKALEECDKRDGGFDCKETNIRCS